MKGVVKRAGRAMPNKSRIKQTGSKLKRYGKK